LYNEFVTHGQAYCAVSASASGNFGIKTGRIYIPDDGSYYASVALRPGNANTAGEFTLTADFFDEYAGLIFTKSITRTITTLDRWAYVANTYSVADIGGSAYVELTVTANPTADYVVGQNFHIDRVVFRQ
jgi:hypothetical protein